MEGVHRLEGVTARRGPDHRHEGQTPRVLRQVLAVSYAGCKGLGQSLAIIYFPEPFISPHATTHVITLTLLTVVRHAGVGELNLLT